MEGTKYVSLHPLCRPHQGIRHSVTPRTVEHTSSNWNPPKMVKIIRCFHNGMNARFVTGSEDDEFPVTNGVKEGCVLAPTLFSFLFSIMLLSAFKDSDPGIQITYRTDGGVFNTQRLKAKTKVTKSLVLFVTCILMTVLLLLT